MTTAMTTDTTFGTFFLPGPTEVRREVLEAMLRPMIAHRGKEFEALYARLQEGLRVVFRTARPVFVSSSSATGLMEAAVRCAPPGPILAVVNGAFSSRFAHIGRACGRETDVLDVPWGQVPDLDQLRERLAARHYAAMTIVHSETSTGALTDVRQVQDIAREHDTFCLVDSVTGLAGTPVETDAWDMDFVLTGSQKALAMPPGLAFGVASERYMHAARETPQRGLYFDLVEFAEYGTRNQTPNTPALPLLYAADAQLAHIVREGMDARWARHRAMAERTRRWVEETGAALGMPLGILAPEGARATTVTAIVLPDGVTGPQVAAAVNGRGFVVGSGYGKVKELTFRVGHMGDHTLEGLERCLAACREALASLAP